MSYTTCPGCGTGVDQFGGAYYTPDGLAIHNSNRCRARRKRPDCGHSRDCDGPDGRCEWCLDVSDAISTAQEATNDLIDALGKIIVEVLVAHRIAENELVAICSEIGVGTAKWMREDRERGLSALNLAETRPGAP